MEPKQDDMVDGGVKSSILTGLAIDGAFRKAIVRIYPEIPSIQQELEASRDNFSKGVGGSLTSSVSTTASTAGKVLDAIMFDVDTSTYKFRSVFMVDGLRVYGSTGGVPKSSSDESALDMCVQGFSLLP